MDQENLSAVLHGVKDLRLESSPLLQPGPKEAVVRVQACGVCMTDVHLLDAARVGDIALDQPCVIGHEFSGYVIAVGHEVTDLAPGDRVAVDNLVACGTCARCREGRANTCADVRYVGFPPVGRGGLARFTTLPNVLLHRIPDSLDLEEAAMMEPLSVCVNAARRADVKLGDCVIVMGAGPIGLMTSQVARARGASFVCVTDVDAERLRLAKSLGATHTVQLDKGIADALVHAAKVRQAMPQAPDVAIDCTGAPVCIQTAVKVVRRGGVVAVVGLGPEDISIPMLDVALREIDIRGCVCNNYCFPTSLKLVSEERVRVKPIISHRFPLKEIHAALDLVRQRKVVKVMIDCSTEDSSRSE